MKRQISILLLTTFLFTACAPSKAVIQTAIAETNNAEITKTPFLTNTPVNTLTPTLTVTPIPTLTPTPDIRIINTDPRKLLLQVEDLPDEGKYYLPNSTWTSLETNEEIISNRGVEKGREYVIETKRVVGWFIVYKRGTRAVRMPDEVYCFVAQHENPEGAQLAVNKFNVSTDTFYKKDNFKKVDINLNLGDVNFVSKKIRINSGGENMINYEIDFSYRNYRVALEGYGTEKDVSHDFMVSMAKIVLKKLQNSELEYPPTATPTPE